MRIRVVITWETGAYASTLETTPLSWFPRRVILERTLRKRPLGSACFVA